MTVGSLFAGIGGFDLGFQRAGYKIAWQVEIDPFCRKILAKHFPEAERFEDVRTAGKSNLVPVDVLCGGFPCQDISTAGRGAGLAGARSGLWVEYARIISEIRPKYVVVENVRALLGRGLSRVLGDLTEIGYDAEWRIISAADIRAPHRRERIWIVAHPRRFRWDIGGGGREERYILRDSIWDAPQDQQERQRWLGRVGPLGQTVADPASLRQSGSGEPVFGGGGEEEGEGQANLSLSERLRNQWCSEPSVGRVANGVPNRVDRLRSLGNAVVPQIPEWIANQILKYERNSR